MGVMDKLPHVAIIAGLSAIAHKSEYLRTRFLDQRLAEKLDAINSMSFELRLIPAALVILAVAYIVYSFLRSRKRVFLLDFACCKPPQHMKVTVDDFIAGSRRANIFTEEELAFQRRISERNGLGEETYLPTAHHTSVTGEVTMEDAREEARVVMFSCVSEILERTGLEAKDIDFLILNCSLFCPTPSLTAMIINHFKMPVNIQSYNLSGMGCSASVISVGLAQRLLRDSPGKNALIVSTENITQNWYKGSERCMQIPNTLFRVGGAAIILTNKFSERHRAKYELEHVVRVHLGSDDMAYQCVYQREDDNGKVGVELNKDLVKVASTALQVNLTTLGPLVLPYSEQLKFALNYVQRKFLGMRDLKPYVPDFKKAFNHFCLHAGGRGVIEGLGGQLGLTKTQVEPSFNSLYWYGNTSSASIWYAMGFIESCQKVKKGDKLWQIGFGSGFKCNSAVWKAVRNIEDKQHVAWEHMHKPGQMDKVWNYLDACKAASKNKH